MSADILGDLLIVLVPGTGSALENPGASDSILTLSLEVPPVFLPLTVQVAVDDGHLVGRGHPENGQLALREQRRVVRGDKAV